MQLSRSTLLLWPLLMPVQEALGGPPLAGAPDFWTLFGWVLGMMDTVGGAKLMVAVVDGSLGGGIGGFFFSVAVGGGGGGDGSLVGVGGGGSGGLDSVVVEADLAGDGSTSSFGAELKECVPLWRDPLPLIEDIGVGVTVLVGEGRPIGPSSLRAMSSGDVVPSCCVQLEDGGVSTTGEGTTTELSSMNLISLVSIDITES